MYMLNYHNSFSMSISLQAGNVSLNFTIQFEKTITSNKVKFMHYCNKFTSQNVKNQIGKYGNQILSILIYLKTLLEVFDDSNFPSS